MTIKKKQQVKIAFWEPRSYGYLNYKRLNIHERINYKINSNANRFHFYQFNSLRRWLKQNVSVSTISFQKRLKSYQYEALERRVFHHQYCHTKLNLLNELPPETKKGNGRNKNIT